MNSSYMSTLGALRHGARRSAARAAEQPVRAKHHGRRGQLHHAGSRSSARTASMATPASPTATAILRSSRAASRFRPVDRCDPARGPVSLARRHLEQPRHRRQPLRRRGALLRASDVCLGALRSARASRSMLIPRARVTRLSRRKWRARIVNNPPLRINDTIPPSGYSDNIDWRHGNLNTIGNIPTVNIEGFDRLTQGWHDVWNGGSQRETSTSTAATSSSTHDFGGSTLTSISSYDKTHGFYEEDNTGDGNVQGAGTPGVKHDVLIIDMDQEYKQFTQRVAPRLERRRGEAALDRRPLLPQGGCDAGAGHPLRRQRLPRRASFSRGITPPSLFDVIPNPYGNTVSFSISDLGIAATRPTARSTGEFTDSVGPHGRPALHARQEVQSLLLRGCLHQDRSTGIPRSTSANRQFAQLAAGLPTCVPKTHPGYIPFVRCADTNTSREDLSNDRGRRQARPAVPRERRRDALRQLLARLQVRQVRHGVPAHRRHAVPAASARPGNARCVRGRHQVDAARSLAAAERGGVLQHLEGSAGVQRRRAAGRSSSTCPSRRSTARSSRLNWVPADGWILSRRLRAGWTPRSPMSPASISTCGRATFRMDTSCRCHRISRPTRRSRRRIALGSERSDACMPTTATRARSKVKYSPQMPIDEYDSIATRSMPASALRSARIAQYEVSLFGNNLTERKILRGDPGSARRVGLVLLRTE